MVHSKNLALQSSAHPLSPDPRMGSGDIASIQCRCCRVREEKCSHHPWSPHPNLCNAKGAGKGAPSNTTVWDTLACHQIPRQ